MCLYFLNWPSSNDRTQSGKGAVRWGGGYRSILIWFLIVGSLFLMYGDSLRDHVRLATEPSTFNDDARIVIWPFLRYHDSGLFTDDYFAQYYLDVHMPAGFRLLYQYGARLWDPRGLSKALPYVLLVLLLGSVGLAVHKISGPAALWGAIGLCLTSGYCLSRMTGGLQRAFGFPVLACAVAALAFGRPRLLAATVCLGAAFYPPAGIVAGVALLMYLFLLPQNDRAGAKDWSLQRRILLTAVTVLVSFLVLMPNAVSGGSYGALILPGESVSFPETGPSGRYQSWISSPSESYWGEARRVAALTLFGADIWGRTEMVPGRFWPGVTTWIRGDPQSLTDTLLVLLWGSLVVGGTGLVVAALQQPAVRRILLLLAATTVAFFAAVHLRPFLYHPARYIEFPLPVLIAVLFPVAAWGWGGVFAKWSGWPWLRPAMVVGLCAVCLVGIGNRGSGRAGYTVSLDPDSEVYTFVRSLPPRAVIAGWPTGPVNNIPYFCARPALITHETHLVHRRLFLMEMRHRMSALVDAYFATETAPLLRLRDELGVTYLLIDRRHYEEVPAYFEPYNGHIQQAFARVGSNQLQTLEQLQRAAVFQGGPFFVLDLRRLTDGGEKSS